MSLATRCPQCATAFRVLPGQLSAKGGKVRCGKCTAVFDGVAHLVAQQGDAKAALEPSPQLGLFEPGRAPARTAPARAQVRRQPAADEPLPEFLAEPPPRPRYALLWGLLSAIALALLFAQSAYHYRTEIAVLLPQARPYLDAACDAIGCDVGLPRRPELMSIESSELQADGQRDAVILLNAVLRNRAPFAQAYPALELTLTDNAERALARRVLMPADYLRERPGAELIPLGVPPGGEVVLRVPLDTRQVNATGYRLYLFYP